ncbi:MAG TPA: sulfotransferase domain-containing protein, partial [Candidatus Sumerlaeota bacterium]|nr:sulfotransferase domain-containing protein [Candidatus Sumerlaeota bacterium]
WTEHIEAWQMWARKHPETKVAFVAYEELLDDTENQLARVIGQMGLPVPDMNHLAGSVERQSFKTQKLLKQSLADKIKQLDKEGNVTFARRGVSSEWKNFLTCEMAREINTYAGSLILDLGYEQDPNWIEKFE